MDTRANIAKRERVVIIQAFIFLLSKVRLIYEKMVYFGRGDDNVEQSSKNRF